jgi:hypothetical protein
MRNHAAIRFSFAEDDAMTKLTRQRAITLSRALLVCAPVLALGACAPPPPPEVAAGPCDPCAAAAHAQATADQALSLAQQAMAAATRQTTVSREMYERGLRK